MRTSNPALSDKAFNRNWGATQNVMTVEGTINRTGFLLLLVIGAACWPWQLYFNGAVPGAMYPYILIGGLGGFVVAIITCFVPKISPFTTPVYAILEGLFLGAISAMYEAQFKGIVMTSALCTFCTLFGLLMAYKLGMIKATPKFRRGVIAATLCIGVVYLISFVMNLFGMSMPYIHSSGPIGIGISVVIVIVAALNLVLDFDFIERGAGSGAPKYMEWYAAFGLVVTLVWLYIEILRLISKLRSR
ncbi:MAG: putative YccA/Bax inhibitor family protein [Rhodothermales bacterium]|jgi:uncharacterized YccA/Bax inhibitor family protein